MQSGAQSLVQDLERGGGDSQGSLQGGGERPLRFRVPPIRTMLISSVEHWNTSTYRSFIVFLWHFWATIKALSGDFIWMNASPEGRPCREEGNNDGKMTRRSHCNSRLESERDKTKIVKTGYRRLFFCI